MKNKPKFALDNALRYLYGIVQLHGGTLMAIRFKHRGQEYEADTPDEAIRLREILEKYDREEVANGNITEEELIYATTKWTEDKFVTLTENVGTAQKQFLAVLLAAPHGPVGVEFIAKRLGLRSPMALAGIQSGLAKQLRAISMDTRDMYRVEISWTEGERKRSLTLNEGFRLAALDNDWPPEYVRKQLKEVKK